MIQLQVVSRDRMSFTPGINKHLKCVSCDHLWSDFIESRLSDSITFYHVNVSLILNVRHARNALSSVVHVMPQLTRSINIMESCCLLDYWKTSANNTMVLSAFKTGFCQHSNLACMGIRSCILIKLENLKKLDLVQINPFNYALWHI